MSKNRGQSLKRKLSRANKGREHTEPRIITEFIETFGKLMVLKRRTCGNNRGEFRHKKKPYYYVAQVI